MNITKEHFDKRIDEIFKLLTNISLRVVRLERDKNMINLDRYLTYREACSVLGISDRSLSRLIEEEELVSVKFKHNYCCPVNPTAPHNNPSEMYSKHISDGFSIL